MGDTLEKYLIACHIVKRDVVSDVMVKENPEKDKESSF